MNYTEQENAIEESQTPKGVLRDIIANRWFELAITVVIVVNSILIGVETYYSNTVISKIQSFILFVFTIEIVMRFFAAESVKAFFKDGWNIFDLLLVVVGYVPETIFEGGASLMAIRVLRILRVLRLLRASAEIKVIITVLLKSTSAMLYNVMLFGIFIYLFAILGVGMFKLPDPQSLEGEKLRNYEKLMEIAPHSPSNSPDPFGTLGESMFTLFREVTGEDWTDLRYNHITAYELGVIKTPPAVINIFHISWFVISVFLLLNLITGAVINNYQLVMSRSDSKDSDATAKE